MRTSESRLVLVLLLIGWKSGASFLNQSRSVLNAKPITFRHSNENRSKAWLTRYMYLTTSVNKREGTTRNTVSDFEKLSRKNKEAYEQVRRIPRTGLFEGEVARRCSVDLKAETQDATTRCRHVAATGCWSKSPRLTRKSCRCDRILSLRSVARIQTGLNSCAISQRQNKHVAACARICDKSLRQNLNQPMRGHHLVSRHVKV